MTGISLNEFVDNLTFGYEIDFIYHERKFIIQGYSDKCSFIISLDEYTENVDNKKLLKLQFKGNSFDEAVEKMLKNPLIDNKTLYELEKEIIVLFA